MNVFEVVIIKDKRFNKSNNAVIVPSQYITTNSQLVNFVRSLEPPYKSEDEELIYDFVSKNILPPESWGSYKCEKKINAATYEEAIKVLKPLKDKLLKEFNKPKISKPKKNGQFKAYMNSVKNNLEISTFQKSLESIDASPSPSPALFITPEQINSAPIVLNNSNVFQSVCESKNDPFSTSVAGLVDYNDNLIKDLLKVPRLNTTANITENEHSHHQDSHLSAEISDVEDNKEFQNTGLDIDMKIDETNNLLKVPHFNAAEDTCTITDLNQSAKRKIDEVDDGMDFDDDFKNKSLLNNSTIIDECKRKKMISTATQVDIPLDVSNEFITRSDFEEFKNNIQISLNQISNSLNQNNHSFNEATKKISSEITDLTNFFKNKQTQGVEKFVPFNDLQNSFSCNIPIESDDNFLIFNNNIEKNVADLRVKLSQYLVNTISPNKDILDTVREILKKFFKKTTLLLYVAQRVSGSSRNKKPFKDTQFYTCLGEAIMKVWLKADMKIDTQVILKAIGTTLGTVKDWEKKERPSK